MDGWVIGVDIHLKCQINWYISVGSFSALNLKLWKDTLNFSGWKNQRLHERPPLAFVRFCFCMQVNVLEVFLGIKRRGQCSVKCSCMRSLLQCRGGGQDWDYGDAPAAFLCVRTWSITLMCLIRQNTWGFVKVDVWLGYRTAPAPLQSSGGKKEAYTLESDSGAKPSSGLVKAYL